MDITTLGIDIGKNTFHAIGADKTGKRIFRGKFSRIKLEKYMKQRSPCLVAMESCGGAHHLGRMFQKFGHDVRLIAPQHIKAYVDKHRKNDYNDAAGICEAVTRPHMKFVPIKTVEQQDILALHKVRARLIEERTALTNSIRGLLLERGVTIKQGIANVAPIVRSIIDNDNLEISREVSENFRCTLSCLYDELIQKNNDIEKYEKRLKAIVKKSPAVKNLMTIPGIGLLTATLIEAKIGDIQHFKNGRQLAAFLGLVPRQCSTGGKEKLGPISKHGDKVLRTLLIHGARAVWWSIDRSKKEIVAPNAKWLAKVKDKAGVHKAVVAYANKNARIVWAILKTGTKYDPNYSLCNAIA